MDHHPTSFFILENETLGTFWVGQAKMRLDECGFSLLPALTRDELIDKLESKYMEYSTPCLDLVSINKNGAMPFYGVERWLCKLHYKIKQSPNQFEKLEKLLTAGWYEDDLTPNSTLNVLHARNKVDMTVLYKRLIVDWEAKGMRCLNTRQAKTRAERYEESKKDPNFIYTRARKEVLRQMKKTQKMPKDTTIEKYQIKEEEIKECMGPQGIIYKITCKPTGMSYVGQTINLKRRLQSHKSKTSVCTYIKNAIQKYGWDNFEVETLWEGNIKLLCDMEVKFIEEYNTMAPNGYNLIDSKGVGGKVSETTLQAMINSQRDRYIKKKGLLGEIKEIKSKVDGRTTSWTVRGCREGKSYKLARCKTKEEALEVQRKFTNNPDTYEIPDSTRVANGKASGVYYQKNKKRWTAILNNTYLGGYSTKEEAEDAVKRYKEDPDNFVRPNARDPNRDIGITLNKSENKWRASFWNGKKSIFLGRYTTKQEAIDARKRFIEYPENFTRPNQRKHILHMGHISKK
jgi:group I intron endonuclease